MKLNNLLAKNGIGGILESVARHRTPAARVARSRSNLWEWIFSSLGGYSSVAASLRSSLYQVGFELSLTSPRGDRPHPMSQRAVDE
jgi:hypothetical protein